MAEYTGRIVEYLSSGSLEMGLVTTQSASKLQLTNVHGRNLSLAPRQIVIVHPERTDLAGLAEQAREIESAVEELHREVDTELLWESLQGREGPVAVEELAAEYFGESGSRACSAVFRAVIEDRVRFKQKGLEFAPRTSEQVQEQLHALEVRAEKEAFVQRRDDWLGALAEADEPADIPEEFEPLVAEIEAFLLEQKGGEVEKLLEQQEADSTAKEAAFRILVRCGRLPEDADPLLIIAGIEERFAPDVLEAASELEPFQSDPGRTDYSALDPFSIDDPETREIDDALTVQPLNGGGWRVGIHIADASWYVPGRGQLFEAALARGATLYLPNRSVTMLPERLSCDLASLRRGSLRPAVSVLVDLDEDFRIVDWRLGLSQLEVARRLDYDQVDFWLGGGETGEAWVEQLHVLNRLTRRLLEERIGSGALLILKPELKIRVDGQERISIKVMDKDSPSRRLVSELMILANRLTAEQAGREELPMLYRAQEAPEGEIELPSEYDPVLTDQVFRKLKKSTVSLEPGPHSSLGLEAYVQVTSPIRRLADLTCQQQLAAHLAGRPLPHGPEELEEIQSAVRATEKDLRAVERKSNRFFLLKYLEKNLLGKPLEAVVLSSSSTSYQVETTDLYARGRLLSPQQHGPGERVTVRIDKVDPEDDRLIFRLMNEE